MRTIRNTFLITVAISALLASTAAAEVTTYPGMMCERYSGGLPSMDVDAHLENQSTTSDMNVVCPVVSEPTTPSTAARVWVTDASASENVCCYAAVKNTGSSRIFSSRVCSSGSSSGYQNLTMSPPSMNFTFTHRYYYCSVPQKTGSVPSEIRSYRY